MDYSTTMRMLLMIFMAIYQAKWVSSAVTTCGGTIRGRTGTFTSPNYPHPPEKLPKAAAVGTSLSYDSEKTVITCEWEIIVPEGFGIQLNFGEFDMAAGEDECNKGELVVYSGVGKTKTRLDKYCGSDELDIPVRVLSNNATVVFRRPEDFSGKGFLASFIATTPGQTINDFVSCVDRDSDHVGTQSYSLLCPGGCANIPDMAVRGRREYRDDSYLCKAAVHGGVISDALGGRIDVKKLPGDLYYFGSEANGIKSEAGGMSDVKIQFLHHDDNCRGKIELRHNQLTASSYWTEDKQDLAKTKWKPDKALLGEQIDAWSPNDPTTEQWLQVDLKKPKTITGIMTKGSVERYYTTKSYRIAFSNDSTSGWEFYREEGIDHDKVFDGNINIFMNMTNNFIRPRIIARFLRVYPTPVSPAENERYCLQIALFGCETEEERTPTPTPSEYRQIPPIQPISTTSISTAGKTNATTTNPTSKHGPGDISTKMVPKENSTKKILLTSSKHPSPRTPGEPMSENSIIVIAIVAALSVTSILLAALVLFLVKKRKKEPKDSPTSLHPLQTIPDNNNTRFHYKSKKSRKRGRSNTGEHFKNADYKDSLLPTLPGSFHGLGPAQATTIPAEHAHFLGNGVAPPQYPQNGVMPHNGFGTHEEEDSFSDDDDEDHEYQVIDDEHVVNNLGPGSSKASTGSSVGNHSRKSDTMQRMWVNDGNQWQNQGMFPPKSPVFSMQGQIVNGHPHMSSFSSKPNGAYYPKGQPIQRNNTFSHEARYSAGDAPSHPANLRRGNSQSPSHMQRHSSSSNNSSHSYPLNGLHQQNVDPSAPYYSSVPNGEGNPVALNHIMYSGGAIPEQTEIQAAPARRAPSYKVPRPLVGERPAIPQKAFVQNGSDPSLAGGFGRNPTGPPRSDYDRLYRNNSTAGASDNLNNFAVFNGDNSQYDQLNLNNVKRA